MKTNPNTATTIDNSGVPANLAKLFTDIITDIFALSVTFTLAKTDLSVIIGGRHTLRGQLIRDTSEGMAASDYCQLPQLP